MATAKHLDREVSPNERPHRPSTLPPGAPDSQVLPDPPLTAGEKKALAAERETDEGASRAPPGGLGEGVPHGDKAPGAKPPPR